MSKVPERLVVQTLVEQVANKDTKIFLEVPSLGQSVDVAWLHEEEITFIEAKVNDWKRALKQCKNHLLVADYIWIAVAIKNVSKELLEQADMAGIGIMQYREGLIFKLLEARKNHNIWPPQNLVMRNYLISNKHEDPTLDDICNIC